VVSLMEWSWQRADWPEFTWDTPALRARENAFLREAGEAGGAFAHLDAGARDALRIDLLSDEALKTSRIEGEILDRESVQSSLRKNFGLAVDRQRAVGPKERGIAELLVDTYRDFAAPLTMEMLHRWHGKLMQGQLEDGALGCYRSGDEPMQIVSGDPFDPEVHFEAPPTGMVAGEMERFLKWFNGSAPTDEAVPVPALTRSAIAHLHFETIHPFSDGNGRIGRAIAEKVLSQAVGRPILVALSQAIELERESYYDALAATRFSNEITGWVSWFGGTVLKAVEDARGRIEFLIRKTHFFDQHSGGLNARQEKVLRRLFAEGPRGFEGGLSAGNYVRIAKTSPATARRDLGDLVRMGVLSRTGERKGTRYWLVL
jgi:Fic family protein